MAGRLEAIRDHIPDPQWITTFTNGLLYSAGVQSAGERSLDTYLNAGDTDESMQKHISAGFLYRNAPQTERMIYERFAGPINESHLPGLLQCLQDREGFTDIRKALFIFSKYYDDPNEQVARRAKTGLEMTLATRYPNVVNSSVILNSQ